MMNKRLIQELRSGRSTKTLLRRAAAALEAVDLRHTESIGDRIRRKLIEAMDKPVAKNQDDRDEYSFDPWEDIVGGIYGSYSSQSDEYMIITLKAVQEHKTFEAIDEHGFIIEFMLYVLAGKELIDYGGSPRGGWVSFEIEGLWPKLIEKWEEYYKAEWRKNDADCENNGYDNH